MIYPTDSMILSAELKRFYGGILLLWSGGEANSAKLRYSGENGQIQHAGSCIACTKLQYISV